MLTDYYAFWAQTLASVSVGGWGHWPWSWKSRRCAVLCRWYWMQTCLCSSEFVRTWWKIGFIPIHGEIIHRLMEYLGWRSHFILLSDSRIFFLVSTWIIRLRLHLHNQFINIFLDHTALIFNILLVNLTGFYTLVFLLYLFIVFWLCFIWNLTTKYW